MSEEFSEIFLDNLITINVEPISNVTDAHSIAALLYEYLSQKIPRDWKIHLVDADVDDVAKKFPGIEVDLWKHEKFVFIASKYIVFLVYGAGISIVVIEKPHFDREDNTAIRYFISHAKILKHESHAYDTGTGGFIQVIFWLIKYGERYYVVEAYGGEYGTFYIRGITNDFHKALEIYQKVISEI